mgnify:CR=1 FL=1
MENEETMLSLFDYLGKPAGSDLGKAVWRAARAAKIKPANREVSTKTYSGVILVYPKTFLDQYFAKKKETNNYPF